MGDDDPPDGGGANPSNESSQSRKRQGINIDGVVFGLPDAKKISPPSNSYQSVYSKPGFESDSKILYTSSDKGPFIVHVTRSEPDLSAGHSIRILKFAQLIHQSKIPDVVDGSIKALGRNRACLEFISAAAANAFKTHDFLDTYKFAADIPKFHVSRMGVVRDIPTDWTLQELVEGIRTPSNCGEVIRARRLNMKSKKEDTVTWIPSTTVVLTFTGQSLPERVFCYETSLPVNTYQLPTIQCRNCCRFGHIRTQCRSKPRCFRCGQEHSGDSCSVTEDLSTCILCRGAHRATDVKCPEHARQKSIKIVMSQDNISYSEALLRFPYPKRLYADVTSSSPSPFTPSQQMQLSQQTKYSLQSPPPSPAQPRSQSYTKTILRTPSPRTLLGKSYDVQAHRDISNTPSSSQPNGCALLSPMVESTPMLTPNDNLIELLVCSLINIISKFSDSLPNNVVNLLQQLLQTLINKNAPLNPPPMEL